MATGLLYDVHGNLPALDAVLADARSTPVTRWVLGGDYASFGAWPVEVVERMGALDNVVWIRGNWDRWQLGEREDMPPGEDLQTALASVVERLGPELIDRLAALPDGVDARRVVFGHTHLPVDRDHNGIHLFNPGSVGLPFDSDTRAHWAVL